MSTPIENNTETLKALKVMAENLPDLDNNYDKLINGTITTITSKATIIKRSMFQGCNKLEYADFSNVTMIGAQAFANCSALKTLILRNSVVPTLAAQAFINSGLELGTGYLYVPQSIIEEYKANASWQAYSNQIRAIEGGVPDMPNTPDTPSVQLLDGWVMGSTEWQYPSSTRAPDVPSESGERYIIIPDVNISGTTTIFLWWTDEYTNGEIHNIQYLWRGAKISSNEHEIYCTLSGTEKINNGFKISFKAVNGNTTDNKVNYLYSKKMTFS